MTTSSSWLAFTGMTEAQALLGKVRAVLNKAPASRHSSQ